MQTSGRRGRAPFPLDVSEGGTPNSQEQKANPLQLDVDSDVAWPWPCASTPPLGQARASAVTDMPGITMRCCARGRGPGEHASAHCAPTPRTEADVSVTSLLHHSFRQGGKEAKPHSAGTAPIVTLFIPGTPLKPTTYRSGHDPFKTASGVQNSGPWDPWRPAVENSRVFVQCAHSSRCTPLTLGHGWPAGLIGAEGLGVAGPLCARLRGVCPCDRARCKGCGGRGGGQGAWPAPPQHHRAWLGAGHLDDRSRPGWPPPPGHPHGLCGGPQWPPKPHRNGAHL